MGKSSKDQRDIYYRLSKERGYRARSAFKLAHINELYNIFTPTTHRVLDLCAAPGSWSQYILQQFAILNTLDTSDRRLVAVDLQSIAPLPGCVTIKADLTLPSTIEAIKRELGGLSDIVVCDGAPDVSGLHALDAILQHELLTAALTTTRSVLIPGGTFIAKIFIDESSRRDFLFSRQCALLFDIVEVWKPPSSRASSHEHFIICLNYRPSDKYSRFMKDGNLD